MVDLRKRQEEDYYHWQQHQSHEHAQQGQQRTQNIPQLFTRRVFQITDGHRSKQTSEKYRNNFNHFLDYIRIHDLDVLLEILSSLSKLLMEKKERKGNTLEARLYHIIKTLVEDNKGGSLDTDINLRSLCMISIFLVTLVSISYLAPSSTYGQNGNVIGRNGIYSAPISLPNVGIVTEAPPH